MRKKWSNFTTVEIYSVLILFLPNILTNLLLYRVISVECQDLSPEKHHSKNLPNGDMPNKEIMLISY